jgi:hypothetical protein
MPRLLNEEFSDLVQIQVREFRERHQFIIMRVRHLRYGKAVLELG